MSIEASIALVEKLHRITGEAIAGLRAELDAAAARAAEAPPDRARCVEHGCGHPEEFRRQGMGGALPICTMCGCTVKEA